MQTVLRAIVAVSVVFLCGCATVFKGYFDKVQLKNAPQGVQVFTSDGVEIPVHQSTPMWSRSASDTTQLEYTPLTTIELRSRYDQVLVLRHGSKEKKVQAFGKVGGGWLVIDVVLGVVPAAVDALTGNWNSFEPIDASFK